MLHVRHALMNKSVPSSAKQQREITTFTVLMNPFIFSSVYLLIQLQGPSLALSNANKMG